MVTPPIEGCSLTNLRPGESLPKPFQPPPFGSEKPPAGSPPVGQPRRISPLGVVPGLIPPKPKPKGLLLIFPNFFVCQIVLILFGLLDKTMKSGLEN
jgi:hypothetical protein